jgi:glycosyltransferase involved in cell wall biosynthesis
MMEGLTAWTNSNVILVSGEQTDYFKVHYHRTACTIPTAVNMPIDTSAESRIYQKYRLESKKYFLFLGRLSKEKNVDYLIWAFEHIKDYKLVIAGTNTVEPEYVDYLHNQGANNSNIVFTGPAYGADKDWLLRNAYCFCLPSTTEGMSIALLEAMSYKLPIIASDIIPNKEVLKENGLYVRPENVSDLIDAYNEAINNHQRLLLFVENNFIFVKENYTWDKVALKYVDYLKTIVK